MQESVPQLLLLLLLIKRRKEVIVAASLNAPLLRHAYRGHKWPAP